MIGVAMADVSNVEVSIHSEVLRGILLSAATVFINGAPKLDITAIIAATKINVMMSCLCLTSVAINGYFLCE